MARPIQFNRQEVLQNAKSVFWQQGYTATSINDLIDATGLQPGSIYSAFKSKKKLFLEVLDSYGNDMLSSITQLFNNSDSTLTAIRSLFQKMVGDGGTNQDAKGCLLVNTMLELGRHDEQVRNVLAGQVRALEVLFEGILHKAQIRGELAAEKDVPGLAKFLVACIWGTHSLCGLQFDGSSIKAIVDNALSVLEPGPRSANPVSQVAVPQ